ncbi:MAG: aminotransferase class V-fold PLP-dependent enzyme [Limnochordales bacterium]|nr:aminotransferase class V-fold PLP-dependent enzyme [Limnochordales bacterium]
MAIIMNHESRTVPTVPTADAAADRFPSECRPGLSRIADRGLDRVEDQERLPLLNANRAYQEAGIARFHTPGHKGGRGLAEPLAQLLGSAASYDICDEVEDPALGNDWDAAVAEAEALAARLYRVDRSFFLVNGTTSGIQALMLAALRPGNEIIMPRDAHWSAVSGLIMTGAIPVYLPTPFDSDAGVPGVPDCSAYEAALAAHPRARALFMINPNYYGIAGKVAEVAELAHRHGIPLLVDEAHGAHFPFHPDLPLSALEVGADGVAHSVHKLLGALTQASLLHVRGPRLDPEKVAGALRLVTSTSPNPLLCISLDAARWQMARQGEELLERTLSLAMAVRQELSLIPGLKVWGVERLGRPGYYDLDPTKVIVDVSGLGITGYTAERMLRKLGVQIELSDFTHVLALITIGDTPATAERLVGAFRRLAADLAVERGRGEAVAGASLLASLRLPEPQVAVSPRDAFFAPSEWVEWDRAVGRVAAEWIAPYPPGIPLVSPGEVVTPAVIEAVHQFSDAGAHLRTFSPGRDPRQGLLVMASA